VGTLRVTKCMLTPGKALQFHWIESPPAPCLLQYRQYLHFYNREANHEGQRHTFL